MNTLFIEILYEKVKSNALQCSTFTTNEWDKINATMFATTTMDYGVERLKGKWNRLRKVHCMFSELLGHTGVTWDPNTNKVNVVQEVWQHFYTINKSDYKIFERGGFENINDDVDEIPKTRRREEIGISGECRRKELKISKSDKFEACMAQWSSTISLKNEETELRTLYLKEKLSQIQGKSCNQSECEATSPDPYSNIVCLDILNNMEGVSNEVYMKALKAFKDPNFKVSFVKMPEARIDL
ncbi:Myb DNA-bind 3 domain-containing protein [Abeliophyllum distichum]|uniref:Myb DNA-bind 3 domain-containing protein n=1 Tax=Abeliophyllum distichum TaxID=126358 RepID=A0ABD1S8F0_9LAMI